MTESSAGGGKISGGPVIRWTIFIFLLALLVRVAVIFVSGHTTAIGGEPLNIARALAEGGRFADAFGPGAGPTAHTMPAHPLLLSLVVRVWGESPFQSQAYQIYTAVTSAITFALLPRLAVAARIGAPVGVAAGLGGALLPVNFWAQSGGVFESALTGLVFVVQFLLFLPRYEAGRFDVAGGFRMGVASGLGCLVNPTVIPVLVAWGLAALIRYRSQMKAVMIYCVVTAVCAGALLAPWAIRNRIVFGEWIWTRSNLGLELYVSNNDFAAADMDSNVPQPWFASVHPYLSQEALRAMQSSGEAGYSRARQREAVRWIGSHPGRFAALTLERIRLFWMPKMKRPLQSLLEMVVTVAGLAGLVLTWRSRLPIGEITAASFLAYPMIYYLIQSAPRYRYPIEPLLFLLGAYLARSLWRRAATAWWTRGQAGEGSGQPPAWT